LEGSHLNNNPLENNNNNNSLNNGAMEEEEEDLYHVASMIDDLRHDDVHHRVMASKGLPRIAKALGPSRTREELIPFLLDSSDDEDEVLLAMAEAIGKAERRGPGFVDLM